MKSLVSQELSNKVDEIQQRLARQITTDFQNTLKNSSSNPIEKLSLSQLADACAVVSVLENTRVKVDLLKWFLGEKKKKKKIQISILQ